MQFFVCVPLVFAVLAFAGVEPWALAILEIAYFFLVYLLLTEGRELYKSSLHNTFLPAISAVAVLGIFQAFSENPVNAPSMLLFTAWRPATLNAVLLWLLYAAVLFSVPQVIKTPAHFKRLLWVVLGLGAALAVYGMFQKTGDNTMIYGLRLVEGEAFGPFVNRDHAATFLIMASMVGLGIFFSGLRELSKNENGSRFFDLLAIQFLLGVMVCAVLYGVVKTGSRGGLHSLIMAAAIMAVICISFLKRGAPKYIALASVAVLLAAAGAFFYYNPFFLGVEDGNLVRSVTVRLTMYKSGFEMLKDFPFFGTGLGAVEHAFPYYQRGSYGFVRHVHSDWLELFLQTGLVGGLIYLTGFIAAMRRLLRAWLHNPSVSAKLLNGGVIGAVLAACLHNLVDFGSQMPANALLFYTLIGALASKPAMGQYKPGYGTAEEGEPIPPKRTVVLALAAVCVLLMSFTIPPALGWWYDFRAKDAPYPQRIALRTSALYWAPSPRYAFRLGADYFKQALKEGPGAYALFSKSLSVIDGYQLRAPVNQDLLGLKYSLLANMSALGQDPPPRSSP